ncbi:gluconolactonase [Agaricicola taiwanensis]|uniref:Gluconolactonase n=1 Tax=Agaricicola taiwanensis TaxID=591372 RepID=A0A8J3DY45_9RHOB|nr:SMP-30/gluconolactonase/LRE family protein [Agaricicola taiwanensis]GGE49176.1 gluconolactonase [Agaricicola taiwanensis]
MLFQPPALIETTVHARLPDALRMKGRSSGWSFGKDHAHLHSFLEGPAFDRDGNLFVTDIPYGRILKLAPDGAWSVVAEYDGWPNGLAIHRDGRIFIADHLKGLLQLDAATGGVETVLGHIRREGLKGLNDLTFARNGDLYFTDQGQTGLQDPSGRVYRMRADGQIDLLIDNVPSPNGLVLTPDEKFLLVAVTRANQIWRLPLHPDGTTSKVAAFIQLSGGLAGPDGLAMNGAGGLAVAHCGLGAVWIFDRLGQPLYRVQSCEGLATTNLAYGGMNGRSVFITESDTGTILRAELPDAGASLYSHL